MNNLNFVIYFVLLSFYCLAFFAAVKDKKKSRKDFFEKLVVVLAFALFLFPLLFFDDMWKFVAVPSVTVIISTIYLEDDLSSSSDNSNSADKSHDVLGGWSHFGGHLFVFINSCFSLENL